MYVAKASGYTLCTFRSNTLPPQPCATGKNLRKNRILATLLLAALTSAAFSVPFVFKTQAYTPVTRTYYVAADEVPWDYAPSGINQITGQAFGSSAWHLDENTFVGQGPDRIGSVYTKCLYREYTNINFNESKIRREWQHLGTLGPVIRGVVGDTLIVVFKNNCQIATTVHPHGVFYLKPSEGAFYNDNDGINGGDYVAPGAMWTYTWPVPQRAGPGPGDPSSVLWMYHGHVDEPGETNAGLIGPIIITKPNMARADGNPRDVDREFVNLFTVFDENRSPYIDANIQPYITDVGNLVTNDTEALKADDGFIESNLMHSINGFVYGNGQDINGQLGLTMDLGERVRWYIIAMGTEVDLHTPHWHGNSLLFAKMRVDVIEVLPGSMKTLDMVPDNPGTWLYHCHVNDHIDAGMLAVYTVR